MEVLKSIHNLNKILNAEIEVPRHTNFTLAYVPTMGALHAGHLSLVDKAKEVADRVIVSIFVNPLQFGPNEDFDKYPRTLDADLNLLKEKKVDYVFCPDFSREDLEKIKKLKANPELANKLCGAFRPNHFDGVVSIVNYFFELVKPDYAVFGEKDFQQLKIIEDMSLSLGLKVKIIPAKTHREANGLAMSSRNQYLSEDEKEKASKLFLALNKFKKEYQKNPDSESEILEEIKQELSENGFSVEYLERAWDRILVAARFCGVRLIDNLGLS